MVGARNPKPFLAVFGWLTAERQDKSSCTYDLNNVKFIIITGLALSGSTNDIWLNKSAYIVSKLSISVF